MTQVEIRAWNNRIKLHERVEEVVNSLQDEAEPVSYYQGMAMLFAASYIDPDTDPEVTYGNYIPYAA